MRLKAPDRGQKKANDVSRCNAIRHGLTAETVIVGLEDPEDYESFEATIIADYDLTTAVERELVLRLASVLWRLRRATGIETALFQSIVNQPVQLESKVISGAAMDLMRSQGLPHNKSATQIAEGFLRLDETPSGPVVRLSRYEHVLWRQARQILVTLKSLRRRPRSERLKGRRFTFGHLPPSR